MNPAPTDDELIRDVCKLTAAQKWNKNVKYTSICGATILFTTVVGSLAFGPVGLLIGGLLGTTGSYIAVRGEYTSGVEILMSLNEEEKHILGNRLRTLLNTRNVANLLLLWKTPNGAAMIMNLVRAFLVEVRAVEYS